jgi:hypothetical protein
MKPQLLRGIFATLTLAAAIAPAQMHKVAKPEQVVRAVGVYEWTGDFAKPTASRLIPVTVYIESKFEDAGVYIARPIPFALLPGNLYILQTAGVDKGTLDLAYARHLQAVEATGDLAYDDGWFGYGSVKPLAAPRRTTTALKPSKNVPVITASNDPNRPHFGSKPAGDSTASDSSPTKSTSASTSDDPDRPTMKRRDSSTTSSGTTTTTPSTTTASSGSTASSTTSSASTPTDDPDRPTMKRRTSDGSTSSSDSTATTTSTPASTTSTPANDPDRPTMTRRNSDGSTSNGDSTTTTASTPSSTTSAPANDPDRPTMTRRNSDNPTDTSSTTANNPSSPDDPDRPTLKRHSAEDAKRAQVSANDIGGVSSVGSLNNDPDRPNLHHGKPTSAMNETDLPKLTGLPPNLHQMVAVSDAVNRDPHPFTLDWEDEAQHKAILEKMQVMARAQLAAYGSTAASATAAGAKKTVPATTAAKSHRTTQTPPPPVPLMDEELKAYTLSYGGAATYVYSANTGGTGAALRYVTVVAQDDGLGNLKPAIQSVTDAAHLDRSPKLKFVDVVDADASNRASLLFEVRSQNARQFALYRVIASHPDEIFLTGTTQ